MENQNNVKSSYKLFIPQRVEKIIRDFCNACRGHEWSGVLFYSVKGSFETNDLVVTAEDICIMDEGNATHTQFMESPEIANFMLEHNLLVGYYTGLIHSHGGMNAFFSGEDNGTINKEGMDRNHYVSLVVSDDHDYVAKITRKIVSKTQTHTVSIVTKYYNTFGDEKVSICENKEIVEDKPETTSTLVEQYNLTIDKESYITSSNPYLERLNNIRKNPRIGGSTPITSGSTVNNTVVGYIPTPKVVPPVYQNKSVVSPTTLFEELEEDIEEEIDSDFITTLEFDEEQINTIVNQLLTGCIIPNESIDVTKLDCVSHKRFFDSYFYDGIRFTSPKAGMEAFHEFAEEFISFLLSRADDEELRAEFHLTLLDEVQVVACNVWRALDKLPCNNPYIQCYMDIIFEEYLPEPYIEQIKKNLKNG